MYTYKTLSDILSMLRSNYCLVHGICVVSYTLYIHV